jgi:hypothetical protein
MTDDRESDVCNGIHMMGDGTIQFATHMTAHHIDSCAECPEEAKTHPKLSKMTIRSLRD